MERYFQIKFLTKSLLIFAGGIILALLYLIPLSSLFPNDLRIISAPTDPRNIPVSDSPFLEELTWMEVRDKIATGSNRIIIPTGGIEQNGPYLPLNKHDIIVREMSKRIATELGNTLISPIVSFVPEGEFSPPTGHMLYPGTISVTKETLKSLLVDIITSHILHGFQEILVLGDSGLSQEGMAEAVKKASLRAPSGTRVRFIGEYYNYPQLRIWLKDHGVDEVREGFHDELVFTLQLMAINPELVKYRARAKTGTPFLNGVSLTPLEKYQGLGEELLKFRTSEILKYFP